MAHERRHSGTRWKIQAAAQAARSRIVQSLDGCKQCSPMVAVSMAHVRHLILISFKTLYAAMHNSAIVHTGGHSTICDAVQHETRCRAVQHIPDWLCSLAVASGCALWICNQGHSAQVACEMLDCCQAVGLDKQVIHHQCLKQACPFYWCTYWLHEHPWEKLTNPFSCQPT